MRSISVLLIILSLLAITGCPNNSDVDTVAEAQSCLDQASAATAAACKEMVDGMTSADSYVIRCSADFIAQGFTAVAMATAFQQLKNTSGNQGVASMMGFLVFDLQANADTALSDCQQSGVQSFALIASLSDMATLAAYASGSYSGTPDRTNGFSDIAAGITTLDSTTTGQTEVGNVVLAAYNSTCGLPANSGSQMCQAVVSAVQGGGSSPATIGDLFMNSL